MYRLQILVVISGAFSLTACSKKPVVKATTPPAQTATAAVAPAPAPGQTASSPQVGVADDVARQCQLRFSNRNEAPNFEYDAFELLPEDRSVLEQIAQCLTRGPLKGKTVQLVGRADPRGTDEYNLGLGSRRAEMVSTYLQRLGVPNGQLARTTRGELDAAGVDESGWRVDRRVDLELRP